MNEQVMAPQPYNTPAWGLLFEVVVLVAFLLAWGMRFAEEGKPL
jgi:hypothetical protein